MPPCAAARGSPGSRGGSRGIVSRRHGIVAGVVPVGAPLVDVLAEAEKTPGMRRRVEVDRLGSGGPAPIVVGHVFGAAVAPRVEDVAIGLRGALPLRFGGQADRIARPVLEPATECHRVVPRGTDGGQPRRDGRPKPNCIRACRARHNCRRRGCARSGSGGARRPGAQAPSGLRWTGRSGRNRRTHGRRPRRGSLQSSREPGRAASPTGPSSRMEASPQARDGWRRRRALRQRQEQ